MNLIAITIFAAVVPSLVGQHSGAKVELNVNEKGALISEKTVAHKEAHEPSKVIRKEIKEHDVMAPDDADDASGKVDHLAAALDDEEGQSLDELEAVTISAALSRKAPVRRRRAVNCRWTPWTDEGDCSKTCGGGKQKQKRRKAPNAAHGGQGCSGDARQEKKCNDDDCPTTTTTTPATTTMTTAAGAFGLSDRVSWLPFLACALVASLW